MDYTWLPPLLVLKEVDIGFWHVSFQPCYTLTSPLLHLHHSSPLLSLLFTLSLSFPPSLSSVFTQTHLPPPHSNT